MDFIKGLWRDLRARPVDTLVRWQEQRFLWLLMAIAMGGLIILTRTGMEAWLNHTDVLSSSLLVSGMNNLILAKEHILQWKPHLV
ncbi:hypothetical protein MJN54_34695, partial [Salmonella enterica subsp. enterica serovar Kentucky]|nr:hypothetical protein [Salmonella enterica subsp. enterica serovar Kentucky]